MIYLGHLIIIRQIIAKAYKSLGFIYRTFTTNLIEAKRQLYR